MALTVVTSGTTAALTVGTETNLESARTPSVPTVYVVAADFGAMVVTSNIPEVVFFRVYTILLTGGTERLNYCASFIPGQDEDPIQFSVPIPVDAVASALRCTVQQKVGTGRAVPWKLYSL